VGAAAGVAVGAGEGAAGPGPDAPSRFVIVIPIALSFPLDKQKTLAFPARVPLVVGGFALAAPVPPSSSVLPPGAGNQAKKALQPKKERAKDPEQRRVDQAVVTQGQLDLAAIARHDDGDSAAVPTLELAQSDLPEWRHRAGRRGVDAVYLSVRRMRNHPNVTPLRGRVSRGRQK
jgi:hypothetical protein